MGRISNDRKIHQEKLHLESDAQDYKLWLLCSLMVQIRENVLISLLAIVKLD